ncbi:MAG: gliding motility-associated ABC transporter permease subunit GldF [Bacteroidia bacterium]|nr:gliding motility-associated ABC transporter permease subunit GldF [Bacteroidia bacterium]
MASIYIKEIRLFFSSMIGYLVIGFFLLVLGLMIWVFPEYSVLESNYATLAQLFELGPFLFTFLIPAITMRSLAQEKSLGTLEFLSTKPLRSLDIIVGKFLANLTLVILAILPTIIYALSISQLGSPVGNLDTGEILGSYIGLIMLGAGFTGLGILASAVTDNQISAFLMGVFLCFMFYWGFDLISGLSLFFASGDLLIQKLGMAFHYNSISRGVLDMKDLIYFLSLTVFAIVLTDLVLKMNRA